MLPVLRFTSVSSLWRPLASLRHGAPLLCLPHSARQAHPGRRHYASKSKSSKHKLPKNAPAGSSHGSDDAPVTAVISKHKHHAGEVVDELIPGTRGAESDPIAIELTKVESKMKTVVDWYKREVGNMETRGSGRVTPALLDGVRISSEGGGGGVKLEEVATVGVREGNVLVVTLFDESMMKPVKTALQSDRYAFVPQTVDQRTIRIPIPRPTAEAREELVKAARRLAEDARIKIRAAREAGNKAFKAQGISDKRDPSFDKCQKLTTDYVAEIDKIVTNVRKTLLG
ncbi:ribosome recycling factor [Calocera viscosa TUFC12733]|uniref:Ribosome recycling factor n=1 Tax=Calocera viscosa (strain TUFC12733) TaxID=1330018 RepID=A0A167P9Y2_CALVF|nr:ribosome recycling factor [Calocera viscosa TUFC12733]